MKTVQTSNNRFPAKMLGGEILPPVGLTLLRREHMTSKLATEQGVALFIVLALILALSAIAIIVVDRSTTDIDLAFNASHQEKAFYIAEAGLLHAQTQLNAESSWRNGFNNQFFNSGSYSVSVVDSLTDSTLADTILLTAQGRFEQAISNLEALIMPEYFNPFQYATHGDDSMILDNNVCTDSYNSDSGTYAATQLNEQGNVGSNGEILLRNSSIVNGDAQTSDTGNMNIEFPSEVNGDTTSTAPVMDNSGLVPDAEYALAETVNNAPAGFSGSYDYNPATNDLTLRSGDTLVLASGVYYFDDILVRNRANIQLAPGAEVTIYMTGDFILAQGSSVNIFKEPDPITGKDIIVNGNPRDFLVYSKGDSLDLGNLTTFVGAFYSETADIFFRQQVEAYGSFIGKSATIRNLSCVHFDRDLLKVETTRVKGMHIVAWKEN